MEELSTDDAPFMGKLSRSERCDGVLAETIVSDNNYNNYQQQ